MPQRPSDSGVGPIAPIRWQRVIDALLGISGHVTGPATRRAEQALVDLAGRPSVSAAVRRFADLRLPRPALKRLIAAYIDLYDIDLADVAEPSAGYRTLNDFFTRRLRAGTRPIAEADNVIVSAADARLAAAGSIDARGRIVESTIKGKRYSAAELAGDAPTPGAGGPWAGGSYAVLYLSPRDYHRVHSPVDGRVAAVTPLGDARYPVNSLGLRHVAGLFVRNGRIVFDLRTPTFGRVAAIMVGATNVSRISTDVTPGAHLRRGDELGVFNLGSTVVLLLEGGRPQPALEALPGEQLLYGAPLFRLHT